MWGGWGGARFAYVGGGGDDVEVERPRPGGVGAEEDLGAVEAERVVHGVVHLGCHQAPRQEHARPRECRGPPPAPAEDDAATAAAPCDRRHR